MGGTAASGTYFGGFLRGFTQATAIAWRDREPLGCLGCASKNDTTEIRL